MPTYLVKTEPGSYNFARMMREKECVWDGVLNPAANNTMRTMVAGDDVLVYHSGDEKAIVGLAKVISKAAYSDPNQPGLDNSGKPKFMAVDLAAVKPARHPVPLSKIREDERFADFIMLKNSRLSVIPVPAPLAKILKDWAGF
jgi:predicted RNA-binding protein with PUA-like domain